MAKKLITKGTIKSELIKSTKEMQDTLKQKGFLEEDEHIVVVGVEMNGACMLVVKNNQTCSQKGACEAVLDSAHELFQQIPLNVYESSPDGDVQTFEYKIPIIKFCTRVLKNIKKELEEAE